MTTTWNVLEWALELCNAFGDQSIDTLWIVQIVNSMNAKLTEIDSERKKVGRHHFLTFFISIICGWNAGANSETASKTFTHTH